MSFTNLSSGKSHSFVGNISNSCPEKRRYADRFDDPNLTGSMEVSISFRKVSVGTELHIEQTGIPDAIPVEACYLGWQESLALLKVLVEPEIPD